MEARNRERVELTHSSEMIHSRTISSEVVDSEEADSAAALAPCNRTFLVEDLEALEEVVDSPLHSRHFPQLVAQDLNPLRPKPLLKMESASLGQRRRPLINKAGKIQL